MQSIIDFVGNHGPYVNYGIAHNFPIVVVEPLLDADLAILASISVLAVSILLTATQIVAGDHPKAMRTMFAMNIAATVYTTIRVCFAEYVIRLVIKRRTPHTIVV